MRELEFKSIIIKNYKRHTTRLKIEDKNYIFFEIRYKERLKHIIIIFDEFLNYV